MAANGAGIASIEVISQNAYPLGGPAPAGTLDPLMSSPTKGVYTDRSAGCPWTVQNSGANSEPFSFHAGGCNSVFVDGGVRFLSSALDPITCRRLVTRAEGLELPLNTQYAP